MQVIGIKAAIVIAAAVISLTSLLLVTFYESRYVLRLGDPFIKYLLHKRSVNS